MAKTLIAAISALALVGCATPQAPLTADQFAARAVVSDDPMNRFIMVTAPWVDQVGAHPDVLRYQVRLLTLIPRTGGPGRWLLEARVEHRLGQWMLLRHLDYATTPGKLMAGKFFTAPTGQVECPGGRCLYEESATFEVMREAVMAVGVTAGLPEYPQEWRLRFSGQGRYVDAVLPVKYVDGFTKAQAKAIQPAQQRALTPS